MQAFGNMLPSAMQLFYKEPRLEINIFDKFPAWSDNLERTYFFEYSRRKITERADLVRALEERKQCLSHSIPAMAWVFNNDAQGWEPWNQLSDFEIRDGILTAQSQGDDPYMASPPIDIPSMVVGEIEITMLVRASNSVVQGSIYWLATDQGDFSPHLQAPFSVQADGRLHTYRVDLAQDGKLLIGDRIVRLRLDPTNEPGEVGLESIRIYVHCAAVPGESCECRP